MENLGNGPRIVSKEEVTETLQRNLYEDIGQFEQIKGTLKHGQKDRLLSAIVRYPLEDQEFEESELREAFTIAKRISDILVAQGVEIVVESLMKPKAEELSIVESTEEK